MTFTFDIFNQRFAVAAVAGSTSEDVAHGDPTDQVDFKLSGHAAPP